MSLVFGDAISRIIYWNFSISRDWHPLEGLHSGDSAAERDRGLLVRLPAEQELKDASQANGQGHGGPTEGRAGAHRDAKGR